MAVRERIRFFGRVQGVGFRWTCMSLTRQAGVTGWVRNEPDGSVVGEFQAANTGAIDAVLDDLQHGHFIRISQMDRTPLAPIPGEQKFMIAN